MSSWPDPRPALSLFPIWAQCSAPCEVVSQKLWLFLFSWCLPISLQTDFSGSYFISLLSSTVVCFILRVLTLGANQ